MILKPLEKDLRRIQFIIPIMCFILFNIIMFFYNYNSIMETLIFDQKQILKITQKNLTKQLEESRNQLKTIINEYSKNKKDTLKIINFIHNTDNIIVLDKNKTIITSKKNNYNFILKKITFNKLIPNKIYYTNLQNEKKENFIVLTCFKNNTYFIFILKLKKILNTETNLLTEMNLKIIDIVDIKQAKIIMNNKKISLDIFKNHKEKENFYFSINKTYKFGTYIKIKQLNWYILASETIEYIFNEIFYVAYLIFILSLIITLLLFILINIQLKKILKPIKYLEEETNKISNNTFNFIETNTKELGYKEFSEFAKKINAMANSINIQKEQIEQSLNDFKYLFNRTKDCMCLVNKAGEIRIVNNSFQNFFKQNKNNIFDFFNGTDKINFENLFFQKLPINNIEFNFNLENFNKNCLLNIDYINFNNIEYKLIILTDITKLKKQEQFSIYQSRLAGMGEMINNIAHQWKQPLSTINVCTGNLKLEKKYGTINNKNFNDYTSLIEKKVDYLSNTIDSFKNYFKKDRTITTFILEEAVLDALEILKSTEKKNDFIFIKNFQANLLISTCKQDLLQIIINIINNAKDALNDKKLTKKIIFIKTYKENNFFICEILDNAGGIPKNIVDKIFNQYFTTKSGKEGTGIGLHMSKQIANEHLNGNLIVENKKYNYKNKTYSGACFKIILKSLKS